MTSLLGHDAQARQMLEAARGGRLHHGWILAGPRGIGKARFARMMALRLLADATGSPVPVDGPDVPSDHPIARMFEAGSHPDYAELACLTKDNGDLARNITVDQVRGLQRLINSVPSLSHRRVVVIDSADDMERGAANALLKNLEEPPADMIFLVVAHAPARLLPTIRSRCHLLRFDGLDAAGMGRVIRSQLPDASAEDVDVLMRAGEGSPGKALSFAKANLAEMEKTLEVIAAQGDKDNRERLALAKALALKVARPRYVAFLERAPAFIARAARTRQGAELGRALHHWESARQLASSAIILSLDPASVVFELAGHVAALMPGEVDA